MRDVIAIQDLQFGSTGKGQIAGSVAHVWHPDTVVTAWGPNAGHTFRKGGKKWVHTMLATSALAPSVEQILIGPGSVLNVEKLAEEIDAARDLLRGKQLVIHPQAPVVNAGHALAESTELLRIGSTMKGTGAALCDKIMRKEVTVRSNASDVIESLGRATMQADMSLSISSKIYDRCVDLSGKMIVEGAQGFSLGVHNDFYPHTTSRDVSTAQLIADCRLPFPTRSEHRFRVLGVARTFPIRVANRARQHDNGTEEVFTSGGCYVDQQEIQWDDIGRVPELTTVTKLPRRLFSFSFEQLIEACRIMAPDQLALTFCDYLIPPDVIEGSGERVALGDNVWQFVNNIEQCVRPFVEVVSFGPTMEDVYERTRNGPDDRGLSPISGAFLGMGEPDVVG